MKNLFILCLTFSALSVYGQSASVEAIPDVVVLTKDDSPDHFEGRTIKAYETIAFIKGFKATGAFRAFLVSRATSAIDEENTFTTTRSSYGGSDAGYLLFYPNPVNDRITFKGKYDGSFMTIVNNSGEMIMCSVLTGEDPVIEVSELVRGKYFLRLDNECYHLIKN